MTDLSIIPRALTGDRENLAVIAVEMIDSVLKASGQVIWTASTDGTIIDGQGAVEEILGAPVSEITGRLMVDLVAPEDLSKTLTALATLIETGEPARNFETTMIRPDGTRIDVRAGGVMSVPDKNGESVIIGVATDVSAEKEAQRELEAERRRFFEAFKHAPVGILFVHLDPDRGVYIWRANDEACLIADIPRKAVEDTWMRDTGLIDLSDSEVVETMQDFGKLLSGEVRKFSMDRAMTTPTGERRIVRAHVAALDSEAWRTEGDLPVNGTIHLEDVTTQVDARERLQYLASHDPLTGLWNRQFFAEALGRHLTGKRSHDAKGGLIVLDLDDFKQINDTWGHHAGDAVLQSIGGLLRSNLRDTDMVARLGGDEFGVLLPGITEAAAERVATKLNGALSSARIPIRGSSGKTYSPKASIGVLILSEGSDSADRVLRLCDTLMYESKNDGGDSYVLRTVDGLST